MSKIPDKIEIVVFICSACNKRSRSAAVADKMTCQHCGEKYRRVDGEWAWRMEDNPPRGGK